MAVCIEAGWGGRRIQFIRLGTTILGQSRDPATMFMLPHHSQVLSVCREFGIRRLEVFGSAVHAPATANDVDLLVDFGDRPVKGFSDLFFGFKEKLEAIFGKPVDLVTSDSLGNPYFRQSVEASKQLVYEG